MPTPKAVLLDINGTIFDPITASAAEFEALGLDPGLVGHWFAEVLRDGFAAQLAGVFAPLAAFAEHHLQRHLSAAGQSTSACEAAQRVMTAWAAAQPYDDVGPGLRALEAEGLRVAALTNGSAQLAGTILKRAKLTRTPLLLDITEPHIWKPAKEAYRFAVNALLLQPNEVMLVAVHPWDCHGALQAGLQACFVRRDPHECYPAFLDQPQLIVDSFEDLALQLLAAT